MNGIRGLVGLAVAATAICGTASATYIDDPWWPKGDGGRDERNLYQIYNNLFDTHYWNSNQLPQVAYDEMFDLTQIDSIAVFLVSYAGYDQTFGWYQTDDDGNVTLNPVFEGTPDRGDVFSLVDPGDTIDGSFGFYSDTESQGGMVAYSQSFLNSDLRDHMVALNTPYDDLFLLAFEDIPANHHWEDFDYNDMVIAVRGVSVVPEPASVALLGLGIAGLAVRRLRGTRTVNS